LRGVENHREDAVDVAQDVVVPEAKHGVAVPLEKGGAGSVGFWRVLPSVSFHDQHPLGAEKVGDVGADRGLAAELEAGELAVAEVAPKADFGIG
jgi:hypothetical protein